MPSLTQRLLSPRTVPWLVILTAAALTLSSTLLWPYLFMDETWFILPWLYHVWSGMGRPLLSYVMLATEYGYLAFGLNVIYLFRAVGILLLFSIGMATFAWLRCFHYRRFDATVFAAGLISLPAFQILSATSVQLGAAVVAVFLAAFAVRPLLEKPLPRVNAAIRVAIATVACFAALCIYQASLLILFALLLVPMLQIEKGDTRKLLAVLAAYAWITVITGIYYGTWIALYRAPAGGLNAAYGPHAASLWSAVSALGPFVSERFVQVANLWHVENFQPSPFFFISAGVVAVGLSLVVFREGYLGMLKAVIALGTLPVCDLFRLAANKGPTYTTLHPLATAWWLLFACLLYRFGGTASRFVSVPLVASGIATASFVTTPYIAQHNAPQLATIKSALRAAPNAKHIHVVGLLRNFDKAYEYGWTSGAIAADMRAMVCSVSGSHRCGTHIVTTSHMAIPDPPGPAPGPASVTICLKEPPK